MRPASGTRQAARSRPGNMIQFTLKCSNNHRFESWFQSSEAYNKLERAGMMTCAICGDATVTKAVMAPRVAQQRSVAQAASQTEAMPAPNKEGDTAAAQALAALKAHVESTSDYVGTNFVREARAMHEGSAPTRAIYGEAKPEEARRLLADGVPIAALPFVPKRNTN
ncbi:MAG: DUF1178 family protein [Rhodobacterales bacterium]